MAQTIFGLLIFTGMLLTWLVDGSLVSVTGTSLSPEKIAEAEKWMSITWAGIIAGFVVGFGIATIYDVRRLRQTRLPQSAIGTAAALTMIALVVPNQESWSQQVETSQWRSPASCSQALASVGQETGDGRQETGDGRRETGDRGDGPYGSWALDSGSDPDS
jgi:hypothetical protein